MTITDPRLPDLRALVAKQVEDLQFIKYRYFHFLAVHERLKLAVDDEGNFTLRQLHLYYLLADQNRMLVIDLCSYCKGWIKPGGFIGKLQNFSGLMKKRPWNLFTPPPRVHSRNVRNPMTQQELAILNQEMDRHSCQRQADYTVGAFKVVFPQWDVSKNVQAVDFNDLKERTSRAIARLGQVRNEKHAHRYETGSVENINDFTIEEFEDLFRFVESILESLHTALFNESYGLGQRPVGSDFDESAIDVVDLMLCGSIADVVRATGIQDSLKAAKADRRYYHQFRGEGILHFREYSDAEWLDEDDEN